MRHRRGRVPCAGPDQFGVKARAFDAEGLGIHLADEVKIDKAVVDRGHDCIGAGNGGARNRVVSPGRVDHDKVGTTANACHFLIQSRRSQQAKRDMAGRGQVNLTTTCGCLAIVQIACHCPLAGVEVNGGDAVTRALQGNGGMDGCCRLAGAALFVGEDNDMGVLRHRCYGPAS